MSMIKENLAPRIVVSKEIKRNAHLYKGTLDGKEYGPFKSVTHYLKIIDKSGPLTRWAAKIALENAREELLNIGGPEPKLMEPDFINGIIERAAVRPLAALKEAGDFGTRAHALFDRYVTGQSLGEIPDDLKTALDGLLKFLDENEIAIVQGDTKVISLKHGYGGTFDAIATRKGKYGILDWKTSNACYPEMALQVAAYCEATYETMDILPKWGMVIRFGKNIAEYEAKEVYDLDASFQAFLTAKKLVDYMKLEHFKGA